MSLYEIAFSGQTVPGTHVDVVKENLARLFQADTQRIALLFSGRRIVIKNNLDATSAEKYRATLERAGAVVDVDAMEVLIEEIEMAPPPPMEPAAAPVRSAVSQAPSAPITASVSGTPPPLKIAPRDEYMAAFIDVEAPDFGIAPLGSELQENKADPRPPAVDLSQFSLAPPGVDMDQAPRSPTAPPPDTSHLTLQ